MTSEREKNAKQKEFADPENSWHEVCWDQYRGFRRLICEAHPNSHQPNQYQFSFSLPEDTDPDRVIVAYSEASNSYGVGNGQYEVRVKVKSQPIWRLYRIPEEDGSKRLAVFGVHIGDDTFREWAKTQGQTFDDEDTD